MTCPCEECIKFPVCITKESIFCIDLYKFCVVITPEGKYERPDKRGILAVEKKFNKRFAASVLSEAKIVLEDWRKYEL